MRVYLSRHSLAVDPDFTADDAERHLTDAGRERARNVGCALKAAGAAPDMILTSPLVRAVQTAELYAAELGYERQVEVLRSLAPGFPPRVAAQELPSRGVDLLLVGHEPGISMLGAFLVSQPSFPPFRPGQVCLIERGQPAWSLHPERLDREPLLVGT